MKPGIYMAVESGNLVIWYPPSKNTQTFEYYRDIWKSETISYFTSSYIHYTVDYELVAEL